MKSPFHLTPMTLRSLSTFVIALVVGLLMPGTVLAGNWQVNTETGGTYFNQSGGTLNVGGSAGTQSGQLAVQYSQPLADVGSVIIDYNWLSSTDYKARVGVGLYDSSGNDVGGATGIYITSIISDISGGGGLSLGTGTSLNGGGPGGPGLPDVYQIAPFYFNGPISGSLMIQRNGNDFQGSYLSGGSWHTLFDDNYDFGGVALYPWIFTSNSNNNPSWQVTLNNFSADVVPEPSSIALAAFGLAGLAAWSWRRRRA